MSIETAIKSIHKMGITTKTVINIMYTSRVIEDAVAGVLKPYDLSSQQYNVMRILRGQKGAPANLCTIQERMIDKSSNTTRLVDKLIQKNWVKRSVCKANRRKVEITITEAGLQILKELDPLIEKNNENLVSGLSPEELEGMNRILDSIRTS
jgi:DNA-binding MarR family transcriptional regulator